MKNVLLLCMSPLNLRARINEYSYKRKDGSNGTVKAIMTNEAPTKAVIEILNERGGDNHLDKVVMIRSDAVKKPIEIDEKTAEQIHIGQYIKNSNFSHVDLYKKRISDYVQDERLDYKNRKIEYAAVDIADFTEDYEVSGSVIKAARLVAAAGEKVNLFIDFNGGQRYVAFMILAIANLMKIRNVDIDQILTMNFDNKKDEKVFIQNMKPVFDSFDLVSGINEYVNYGRIKTLRKYFESPHNKEINKILEEMEKFSNNLQLCRTGYVMENRADLLQRLQKYSEQSAKMENPDTYEQLFAYVVDDILAGYKDLLKGALPDIIRWCVDKDFIQQALTFTAEEMPGYFWKSGILKASEQEKKEYDKFLELLHKKNHCKLKKHYRKKYTEKSSKYAYEWMINYLPHSSDRDYQAFLADSDIETAFKRLNPKDNNFKSMKAGLGRFTRIDMKGVHFGENSLDRATQFAAPLIWHTKQKKGRATCGMKDKLLFNEVLVLYFLLKEQRNLTNHADGEADEADIWSYEQLCRVLEQMVKFI